MVILSASLQDVFIYSGFLWNQTSIAQKFCVNKKDDCCKGKCFLKKTLAEEKETEQNQPINLGKRICLTFIIKDICDLIPKIKTLEIAEVNFFYSTFYTFSPTFDVFHPPKSLL